MMLNCGNKFQISPYDIRYVVAFFVHPVRMLRCVRPFLVSVDGRTACDC